MRILQVHNSYQQPGGEDQVCRAEYELLCKRGNHVSQYLIHNDAINGMSRAGLGINTIWNSGTYRSVRAQIAREQPDLLHAHNTFPLLSPAIYYAAAAERVPVVQTLHNFRLICPAATLFRDGHVCEECLGSAVPYKAVVHRCYRNSAAASFAAASMLVAHGVAGTWREKIGTYIALSTFSKDKFVQAGLPAERIAVKPNCVASDPGMGAGQGGYACFVGRITEEKGLRTLLTAWTRLGSRIPLKIAGDGPLTGAFKREFGSLASVEWMGHCERDAVMRLLQNAAFLVFPSRYYENLPMSIIEAFACGTPVVASGFGSMNELIAEYQNGLRFAPGDPEDLVSKIERLLAAPDRLLTMRHMARLSYERNYTASRNYDMLMDIYAKTIQLAAAA